MISVYGSKSIKTDKNTTLKDLFLLNLRKEEMLIALWFLHTMGDKDTKTSKIKIS